MSITIIIIVLVVILLFIIGMFLLFWKLSKLIRPDVPPNSPLIFSLDTLKTKGFAFGVQKEIKNANSSSTLIEMKPLDLPYDYRGKPVMKENFDFAIRNEKKIELPTGALSYHRSCIILLPESSANLNSEFRNTEFGMAISGLIELRNFKDKAIDIISNRQAGERSHVALLEEAQNQLMSFYKGMIQEVTSQAKEKAVTQGGLR